MKSSKRLGWIGLLAAISLLSTSLLILWPSPNLPPAGVIPYACQNNDTLVLLAFDRSPGRNGWAAFGGGANAGESIAETAAREFHEETGCVFNQPNAKQLSQQPHSQVGPFHTWVAEVDFQPTEPIAQSECGTAYERRDWIWFRLQEVQEALSSGGDIQRQADGKAYPLWDKGRLALQAASEDGLLDERVCQKTNQ